jgi:hypothetical protein
MHEIKNLVMPLLLLPFLCALTIGLVREYQRSRRRTASDTTLLRCHWGKVWWETRWSAPVIR